MKRNTREPIYSTAVVLGRSLFGFWRLQRRSTGLSALPNTGGAVLAITHFGYLDFALVEWVIWLHNRRRVRFMAKKGAFDKPLVGTLLRGMRHIEVDPAAGAAAYGNAVTALQQGELLGVFPEAGVNASFTVRALKTGAVRLAAESGVPIIPIAVWGGHRLMTKNHRIGFRERFGVPVTFSFGEPMTVSADEDVRDATSRLHTQLQTLVDDLQHTYPVTGAAKWWQPAHLGGTAPTPAAAALADAERDKRRAEAKKLTR